jgi:hypothetical protein
LDHSHFHSDHYSGLVKSWKHGIICCTRVTANLAQYKFQIKSEYFKILGIDQTYEIEGVKVTLFDANHCPGSCCILFETSDGKTYFHTGDMRFDKDIFMKYKTLQPFFKHHNGNESSILQTKRSLDIIYLDTTYCNPKYSFPKQSEATRFIADFIKSTMDSANGKRYLFLFGTYYIGKERIAQRIIESCNCKVFVTMEKHKILNILELPYIDIFTTNASETSVHMVAMNDLSWRNLLTLSKAFWRYDEIIAFRPSAWCFSEMEVPNASEISTSCSLDDHFSVSKSLPKENKTDNEGFTKVDVVFSKQKNVTVISVPYSEHSSFSELKDCVGLLRTKEIRPTVFRDQRDLIQIKNYLSDAYKNTPLKLKLSAPAELLNALPSPSKPLKIKKNIEIKNNHKITSFFRVVKKTDSKIDINANTKLEKDTSHQISSSGPLIKVEKSEEGNISNAFIKVISSDDEEDSSKGEIKLKNSKSIIKEEDYIDLSGIDISEQFYIMSSIEKQQNISNHSISITSNKPKTKPRLQVKRKCTSSNGEKKKKSKGC